MCIYARHCTCRSLSWTLLFWVGQCCKMHHMPFPPMFDHFFLLLHQQLFPSLELQHWKNICTCFPTESTWKEIVTSQRTSHSFSVGGLQNSGIVKWRISKTGNGRFCNVLLEFLHGFETHFISWNQTSNILHRGLTSSNNLYYKSETADSQSEAWSWYSIITSPRFTHVICGGAKSEGDLVSSLIILIVKFKIIEY